MITQEKASVGWPLFRRWLETLVRWARAWQRLALVLLAVFFMVMPVAAQDDPRGRLLGLINQGRLNEGLAPLGNSTLLNQAAQRHAEDLVGLGRATHQGSDGASYQQRIREMRYQAWNDGLLVAEVVWTGLGSEEDALEWFVRNSEWSTLTDARYREIGVGYADDDGVRYFVVNLGSRPAVLPVFINDGIQVTESPQVALRLTNEEAEPLGEGTWMGRAIEVRFNNVPDFTGLPWQPWEPLLPWRLADEVPGEYAVYVEFRDGAGRTAVAADTIRLVLPGESPPTPTPFPLLTGMTPQPDDPISPETPVAPLPPNTDQASESSTPDVPAAPDTTDPDGAVIPYPTWTPLTSETPLVGEPVETDWSLLLVLALQGAALLLGAVLFLRRR